MVQFPSHITMGEQFECHLTVRDNKGNPIRVAPAEFRLKRNWPQFIIASADTTTMTVHRVTAGEESLNVSATVTGRFLDTSASLSSNADECRPIAVGGQYITEGQHGTC